MNSTKAKKLFKKRFGSANHLLITTLVGLDSIETGIISEKPKGFNTSWNPVDPVRSAERARIITLKSFLGWAVESLEMYLTELNRKPKELASEELTAIYSKAGRSIYKKAIAVGEHTNVDPLLVALMEILITWRNYTFHYDIDNKIRIESAELLQKSAARISEEFCGLDVNQLHETWISKGDFTFKETASLISATHKYVSEVDQYAVTHIDLFKYVEDALQLHFKENATATQKLKSLPREKKLRFLKNVTSDLVGISDMEQSFLERQLESVHAVI